MLVLSRKKDQTIQIGNGIVIHICQVRGSTVRIGIEAPPDIRVLRGELPNWSSIHSTIRESNDPAANLDNALPGHSREFG